MYDVIWCWEKGGERHYDRSEHFTYNEALDKFRSLMPGFAYIEMVDRDKSTPAGEPYPVKCYERLDAR